MMTPVMATNSNEPNSNQMIYANTQKHTPQVNGHSAAANKLLIAIHHQQIVNPNAQNMYGNSSHGPPPATQQQSSEFL